MVVREVKTSRAYRHEGSIIGPKLFCRVPRSGVLVVGDGIHAWARSKRIDKEWGVAGGRINGTNGAVVEVQRASENVCLPSVVELRVQYDIWPRLVAMRKPSGG